MSKDKIWRSNPAMTATRALRAQQKAMPMIGYLSSGSPTALFMAAFRWAEGHYDRLPALAADLVGRKVAIDPRPRRRGHRIRRGVGPSAVRSCAEELHCRSIKTVPRSRCRKGLVDGDQRRPFCQGRGEVKAIVDCLIEVEGDGLSGRHIACRRQQLDRCCLDCRQGRA